MPTHDVYCIFVKFGSRFLSTLLSSMRQNLSVEILLRAFESLQGNQDQDWQLCLLLKEAECKLPAAILFARKHRHILQEKIPNPPPQAVEAHAARIGHICKLSTEATGGENVEQDLQQIGHKAYSTMLLPHRLLLNKGTTRMAAIKAWLWSVIKNSPHSSLHNPPRKLL